MSHDPQSPPTWTLDGFTDLESLADHLWESIGAPQLRSPDTAVAAVAIVIQALADRIPAGYSRTSQEAFLFSAIHGMLDAAEKDELL